MLESSASPVIRIVRTFVILCAVLAAVRFVNASWARNPDMLRLDYLDLDLRLIAFAFRGEIDLKSVELGEGEVYLETDRDGRGN